MRHRLKVKASLLAATLAAAALTFLASVTNAAGHRTRIDEATGRTRHVTGPILDVTCSALEAARVLRLAKNVEIAMTTPNEFKYYHEIMTRLGYRWIRNPNNKVVGGNWVRPASKIKTLPPPEDAYRAYKELVLRASN